MKLKGLAGLLLVALVAGALVAPAGTAAAKKKKKPAGPVTVATDAADDWGANVDATIEPIGDGMGQELTGAVITMADPATLNFVIQVNSLPANGGAPEVSRYTWDALVDGNYVELDGKWSNYSRGACDPTSGQCPPPRDPGMQPFLVRGDCTTDNTTPSAVTTCKELGLVQAAFDPAAKTITIPVPLELIHAHAGSKIEGGANIFGGNISAAPSAFLSSSGAPWDVMTVTKSFTVPK